MPSIKTTKQRIKSVKNTAQITKAMEVVSATKMRRSQEFALSARPYALASLDMLNNLLSRTQTLPPLLQERAVHRTCVLIVASDKGLAGAFNANVLKKTEILLQEMIGVKPLSIITVGKKAKEFIERKPLPIEKSFIGFGDYSQPSDTVGVADHIINGFLLGSWDEVYTIYMNFRTTLVQETVVRRILPANHKRIDDAIRSILPERGRFAQQQAAASEHERYHYEYKFEPSPDAILTLLSPMLIRIQIHHLILESNASEHSARMVAMKNASNNAHDLIDELTIESNKARQAGITRELTEITAGREALEG